MDAQPLVDPLTVAGIPFLLAEDADRYREHGLPAITELEHDPGTKMVIRALQPAANDSLSDLVIVGWARGAVDLVLADPFLAAKDTVWVVGETQLAHLAVALLGRDLTRIRVAVCDKAEQVPFILSQLTLCWSFAALDARLGEASSILRQAWNRFVRTCMSPQRIIGDIRHLIARQERLADALPLSAWRDQYRGETALCIAAGPSLNESMELVRRFQDRCVVIVVDVVQKRIQAAGIKVDFVLNVDSSASLAKLMTPSPDPHTVLVMPLVGHRELDREQSRRSYFANEAFTDWLLGAGVHTFDKGTTVGIATVGFARFLGCREILLLGHDLAFKRDVYYSEFVDRASHESAMRALSNPSMREIPGNGGGMVPTDFFFQVAVDDLSMLLRRWGATPVVYNHNINQRTGALIDGTIALPDDWQPARRETLPRPACTVTLGDQGIVPRTAEFPQRLRDMARRAADFWREERQRRPTQFSHLTMPPEVELHFAMSYLLMFERGPVYHMIRLHALPPSITVAGHHEEMEDFTEHLVDAAIALLDQVLDLTQEPLPDHVPAHRDTGLTQAQFDMLFQRITLDDEFSMDAAMMPAVATNYMGLRHALPELGMPTPHSANEGLRLTQSLGLCVPRRFIIQTLCLCALEDETWFGPCLTWARTHGLLTPDELSPRAAIRVTDDTPWLVASEAVLRIRHRTFSDLVADAERALIWHPCRLHLLRALIDHKGEALPVLEGLVTTGRLPLDDQLASLLLLNHPDHVRAADLLTPHMKSLGEATVMAIAHREQVRGNHQGALAQVAGIRPLSRFRDQALMIACRSHLATGKVHLVSECAEQIVDAKMRAQWARFLPETGEPC